MELRVRINCVISSFPEGTGIRSLRLLEVIELVVFVIVPISFKERCVTKIPHTMVNMTPNGKIIRITSRIRF